MDSKVCFKLFSIAPVTVAEALSHLCGIGPEMLICWCCEYRSSERLVEKKGRFYLHFHKCTLTKFNWLEKF